MQMYARVCGGGVRSNNGYLPQLLITSCFEKGLSLRLELVVRPGSPRGSPICSSSAEITDVHCSVQLSTWVWGIKLCFSCLYIKHFTN